MKTVALELQPCCGNRSGIGTYVYELARHIKSADGLRFCGNVFNFLGRRDNSRALRGIRIPISECRLFPYGIYRRVWRVLPVSYERFFPTKADLSIFFNYIVPPHVKSAVITTVHDMTFLRFPETMDRRNLVHIRTGISRSLAMSSRVLTVSEFSRKEILELLDLPQEKVVVVPNAPSISSETVPFEHVSQRLGVVCPYVLYVGTVEPRKNLTRLLQAFEILLKRTRLPHQLVIAGGRGWQTEEFDHAYGTSPVRDRVILTGYISDAEKNTLYQHAALFVFPSLYEGFGIPPLEAMYWGCPVVCAQAASLPEVVGDAAELVDPRQTESIASGMERVLTQMDYAHRLVERGNAQVKRYSWSDSAQRLVRVCREVLC